MTLDMEVQPAAAAISALPGAAHPPAKQAADAPLGTAAMAPGFTDARGDAGAEPRGERDARKWVSRHPVQTCAPRSGATSGC